MDAHAYPGKGLSLSELVFALSQELKRVAYSPSYVAKDPPWTPHSQAADLTYSFTFDTVSQLDQDVSTALAAIREWRNSFVPINRVPLDVLSLIPTHLSAQRDRFRTSSVCRHWRRTFLQHAALWSWVYLPRGEAYTNTLLGRAKGSTLDIITSYASPPGAATQLRPYAKQIGYLDFVCNHWDDIQRFSEVISEPLPLLHTLRINAVHESRLLAPGRLLLPMTPPSLPLLNNAVNLKKFFLYSEGSPFINHFTFPNLTTFELSARPKDGFRASQLLDFLETSPMLQTVRMKVFGGILLEGVPPTRIVVLPNVEIFSLAVNDGGPGYKIAAHISCPSVRVTLLKYKGTVHDAIPQEILPSPISWNAIARQYTRNPVEEVILDTLSPPHPSSHVASPSCLPTPPPSV